MNVTAIRQPHQGLLEWLHRHGVEHQVHEHDLTFTATGTARAEGVDARTFAKVVGVATDDGRRALLVVDAPDHVDLHKGRSVLMAHDVRLLTEEELTTLAPSCEAGALPAIGELFGVPILADHALRDQDEISFNAGTHRHSVRVDRAAWEHAANVQYADLATDEELGPVWARS